MAGEEDARQRLIRDGRVRKGKVVVKNSHWKDLEVKNPYVPKARRRRDLRIGGEEESGSQSQMDYSQVVDPTKALSMPGMRRDLRDMIGWRRQLCFISRRRRGYLIILGQRRC